MSYCRFSNGDVYLYETDGGIECCRCALSPRIPASVPVFTPLANGCYRFDIVPCQHCDGSGCPACVQHGLTQLKDAAEAYWHLLEHRARGHHFPQYAIEAVAEDVLLGRD